MDLGDDRRSNREMMGRRLLAQRLRYPYLVTWAPPGQGRQAMPLLERGSQMSPNQQ